MSPFQMNSNQEIIAKIPKTLSQSASNSRPQTSQAGQPHADGSITNREIKSLDTVRVDCLNNMETALTYGVYGAEIILLTISLLLFGSAWKNKSEGKIACRKLLLALSLSAIALLIYPTINWLLAASRTTNLTPDVTAPQPL